MENFIKELKALNDKTPDAAMSLVIDQVFDLVIGMQYKTIDKLLEEALLHSWDIRVMTSFLMVTKPAAHKLNNRTKFLEVYEQELPKHRAPLTCINLLAALR